MSTDSSENKSSAPDAPFAKNGKGPRPQSLRDRVKTAVSKALGSGASDEAQTIRIRMNTCQAGLINEPITHDDGTPGWREVGMFVREQGKDYDVESEEALRLISSGQATPVEELETAAA